MKSMSYTHLTPNLNAGGEVKEDKGLIKDHFTLSNPTSTFTIANKTTHVLVNGTTQITLENCGESIKAKQTSAGTAALNLIRGSYTLVAVLMSGFLFVFCCQFIGFLFMGLAIQSGTTSKQEAFRFFTVTGTFFSIPTVVIGLAGTMNLASSFVLDTWRGHCFTKSIISVQSVLTDWITFFVFFLIPITVGTVSLYAKSDIWWEITSMTWFFCVFAYYLLFAGAVTYYEVKGAYEMVRYSEKNNEYYQEKSLSSTEEFFDVIKRVVLLRQVDIFAGVMSISCYDHSDAIQHSCYINDPERKRHVGFLSKIKLMLQKVELYEPIDPPERIFDIDEVRERYPIVTNYTWGLEQIYLRNRKDHFIAIVRGKNRITHSQAQSSFVCAILGQTLTLLSIISFMVWLESSSYFIVLVIILFTIFTWNRFGTSYGLRELYGEISLNAPRSTDETDLMFYVNEQYRITKPTPKFCWFLLCVEIALFVIYPIISLFVSRNFNVGLVFLVIAIPTAARRYISAPVCFRAHGSIDGIEKNNKQIGKDEEWREKHRLSNIVCDISQGRNNNFWIGVFAVVLLLCCFLFMAAISLGINDGATEGLKMIDDFVYEGNSHFPYPTCSFDKGIKTSSLEKIMLADFTFLSTLAYLDPNITQNSLDKWFGKNEAEDKVDIVKDFQSDYKKEENSAVSYKLIAFPSQGIDVVTIRGTANAWDALSDFQLWSGAAGAQIIRSILPLGEIWNPILRHLVEVVSVIESKSLKDVSFYRETTKFVEMLKKENFNVTLTGHSLGGGLAMITGTQTKCPALAVSGPNTVISRDTFYPPLDKADIDQYTFNVIPDRDPVAMVDDPGQNHQRISCTAPANNPLECHGSYRSLCEILYTCGTQTGTQKRPALCICHNKYNYPKPTPTGNRTYEEACPKE